MSRQTRPLRLVINRDFYISQECIIARGGKRGEESGRRSSGIFYASNLGKEGLDGHGRMAARPTYLPLQFVSLML